MYGAVLLQRSARRMQFVASSLYRLFRFTECVDIARSSEHRQPMYGMRVGFDRVAPLL
jgi:hypothetical protein